MHSAASAFPRREPTSSAVLVPLFPYGLVLVPALYLFVSGQILLILRWHYLGGGSAIEKFHPATYLLLGAILVSLVFHPQFRRSLFHRISSDLLLVSFVIAILSTTAYDVVLGSASIAPFVDTFLSGALTALVLICVPASALLFLRRIVDLFFIFNILLIFVEYVQHVDFVAPYVSGITRTPEELAVLGAQVQGGGVGRLAALFDHPLSAAMLFGIYSIANLVSLPMRLSGATLVRLGLSILSYLAIFPTESRSSMVVTTIILALYLGYFAIGTVIKGRVSPLGLSLALCGTIGIVFAALLLWNAGFFDNMLMRFQYDYGSSLTRDYALDILQSISPFALWFGLSQSELSTLQQSFGLIAVEISWVNFVLVGGLVTTIPLFMTFCLFLFRCLPRYCSLGIYFVSSLILESTFASNSIWTKTTVVTSSLIVGISMLRRDAIHPAHVAINAAPRIYRHGLRTTRPA